MTRAQITWSSSFTNLQIDTTYSSFDPTAFKDKTPECSGTTTNIGGVNAPSEGKGDFSVYGSSCTFYSKYFALDHVGYIYAPMTGTYVSPAIDATSEQLD